MCCSVLPRWADTGRNSHPLAPILIIKRVSVKCNYRFTALLTGNGRNHTWCLLTWQLRSHCGIHWALLLCRPSPATVTTVWPRQALGGDFLQARPRSNQHHQSTVGSKEITHEISHQYFLHPLSNRGMYVSSRAATQQPSGRMERVCLSMSHDPQCSARKRYVNNDEKTANSVKVPTGKQQILLIRQRSVYRPNTTSSNDIRHRSQSKGTGTHARLPSLGFRSWFRFWQSVCR